jgi:ABC-type multidrug transport system fused ATPase/permease subunit
MWVVVCWQMLGVLVITFVAGLAVLSVIEEADVSPGLVGLSLSYALPIVSNLSSLLSSYAETEKELISVERVHEYILQVTAKLAPQRAMCRWVSTQAMCFSAGVQPQEQAVASTGGEIEVPPVWPYAGAVVIQDLSVR